MSAKPPMWKAEFRPMSREERAELRRSLESLGAGFWLERFFDRNAGLRDAMHRDLECGKVQVVHVATETVVRLAHADGTPAGFFVDIGNDLVMFLRPRPRDRRGLNSDFESFFPCSRFSVVRAPHSGLDLEFRCESPPFEALREIKVPSPEVLDAFIRDGEITPGHLESLEEDFEGIVLRSRSASRARA